MRAVLDPNVIISALLSPKGAPARVLLAWQQGEFELLVSQALLAEVERALGYRKLRKRIRPDQARLVLDWLASMAETAADPEDPPSIRSPDPDGDYLIALAQSKSAVVVTGDDHLLQPAPRLPIYTPAQFLDVLSE